MGIDSCTVFAWIQLHFCQELGAASEQRLKMDLLTPTIVKRDL
jgi:hypothetical protein